MPLRLAGFACIALAAMCAGLLVGGTDIPPHAILAALLHPHAESDVAAIVWQLRLPRLCIAATVGSALAVAGALMQGMLRNPLVDPYLTGVSAGAAVAISIAIILGISASVVPALGFASGLAAAVIVAILARRGSGIDATRLILAGIAFSVFCASIVTLAQLRSGSLDASQQIVAWLAGSMAGRGWHELAVTLPYVAAGFAIAAALVPALDALRIGDVRARSIGLDVNRAQWGVLVASTLLTSASVALAGTIGFIGLIVPHLARRMVGSGARALLPASALIGAALCAIADAIGRSIVAPAELPIGVLLAFVGVPVFLVVYLRRDARA